MDSKGQRPLARGLGMRNPQNRKERLNHSIQPPFYFQAATIGGKAAIFFS